MMCQDEVATTLARENDSHTNVAVAPARDEYDSDTDMGTQYIPEGDFRTDLRRKHKYSQNQKKLLDNVEVFLSTIKQRLQ
jgi:hypothetical protein